jgi:hypothetical protein
LNAGNRLSLDDDAFAKPLGVGDEIDRDDLPLGDREPTSAEVS